MSFLKERVKLNARVSSPWGFRVSASWSLPSVKAGARGVRIVSGASPGEPRIGCVEPRRVFEAHWWFVFARFEVSAMKPKFSTDPHSIILTLCCCVRLYLELHGVCAGG